MTNENSRLYLQPPSPSSIVDRIGFGLFQFLLFISLSLLSLTLMMGTTVTGFIIFMADKNWELSTTKVALFGSLLILAMACGSYLNILLEPKLGRWKQLVYGHIIIIVLSVVSTFVPEYYSLLATRFLVIVGLYIATTPGYSSIPEMIPSKFRGMFVSLADFAGSFGGLFLWGYLYLFIPDLEGEGWRLMQLMMCLLFTVPCLVLSFFLIEESPVYLWKVNKPDRAVIALNRIASLNQAPLLTEEEIEAIHAPVPSEDAPEVSITSLFRGKYKNMSFALFFQWFVHTLCLIGGLSLYPYFVGGDDIDASETLTSFLIYSVAVVPPAFMLAFMIESALLGRKWSLAVFTGASALALACPVIILSDTVVIVSFAVFLAVEYSSIMLMFIFTLEIYETELRNTALAFYGLSCRTLVTGATYAVVILAEYSLRLTFLIWVVMQILALATLLLLNYETKGILLDGDTLTQADSEYQRNLVTEKDSA